MAYNNFFPAGYQPYYPNYQIPQQNYQAPQQQQNGVTWVQGIEGAKAHPVAPGQAVLLMDSDASCLYLKSADASGMPSLRVFDYKERVNTPQKPQNADMSGFLTKEDLSDYATRKDLEKEIFDLKAEIMELKKVEENE